MLLYGRNFFTEEKFDKFTLNFHYSFNEFNGNERQKILDPNTDFWGAY